jgi:dienelactone hydrolase
MTVDWPIADWQREPPAKFSADGAAEPGLQAIFLEGLPWRGTPTRVFAWLGMPARCPPGGCPAVVLVHGGGGTAFPDWVRLWNRRGYAAIAIDHDGSLGGGTHGNRPRHPWGGPRGYGSVDQLDDPVPDQWCYHAVGAVIRAATFLGSQPEVDPARVGLVGVSWGGFLACIAAGIDTRFRFLVSVYASGFLGRASGFPGELAGVSDAKAALWEKLWDPTPSLRRITCPVLWLANPNDLAFPLPGVMRSASITPGPSYLAVKMGLVHGHVESWTEPEPGVLADHAVNDGPGLPLAGSLLAQEHRLIASWSGPEPLVSAHLAYTTDNGPWKHRRWSAKQADWSPTSGQLSAELPPEARAAYLNGVDTRGCVASSPLWIGATEPGAQ